VSKLSLLSEDDRRHVLEVLEEDSVAGRFYSEIREKLKGISGTMLTMGGTPKTVLLCITDQDTILAVVEFLAGKPRLLELLASCHQEHPQPELCPVCVELGRTRGRKP